MPKLALFFYYNPRKQQYGYFFSENYNPLQPTISCQVRRMVLCGPDHAGYSSSWREIHKSGSPMNSSNLSKWLQKHCIKFERVCARDFAFAGDLKPVQDLIIALANLATQDHRKENAPALFKEWAQDIADHDIYNQAPVITETWLKGVSAVKERIARVKVVENKLAISDNQERPLLLAHPDKPVSKAKRTKVKQVGFVEPK